jgi:peptidoglycan/LPS O-acetylase OafA/YrhL
VHLGYDAAGHSGWATSSNPFYALILEGHTGVSLFMVLSAFVLSRGTFGRVISYRDFIRNRALRILPLAIVIIALGIAGNKQVDFGRAASWFLLLGNTPGAGQDPSVLVGSLWTATVEFQFYLIAPFLFALTAQRGILKFVLLVVLLFIFLRMTLLCAVLTDPAEGFRISYYTIAGRINQFMIGIAMAYLVDLGLIKFTRLRSLAALLVSLFAILALFTALSRNGGIYAWRVRNAFLPELEGLLWAIFIFGYIGLKPLGRFGRPLMLLGQVSFSMYVLHYAIVRDWWVFLYPKTGLDLHSAASIWGTTIILLVPVAIISTVSFLCIESPFLAMRRRYLTDPHVAHRDNANRSAA